MFAAIKLMQRELGPTHISADIGCHSFATFAPFSLGNSILGYGMSLASAAAVGPNMERRPIAVMGDGGFWHNGLITGVASNLFNKGDGVLIVMQNGYASATGQQYLPSSAANRSGTPTGMTIEQTLRSLGVKWLRTVRSYSVAKMAKTLKEAMRTAERGLKVIIADGECQLVRQRRVRAEDAAKLERGERVVRVRFGVDDEICTGDHSCIRLSGCPSLTVKPNPDPLRSDPVATVIESCVGCGLCGEVAHAAVLCPSFYRAEIIRNPNLLGSRAAPPAAGDHRLARGTAHRGAGMSAPQVRPITLLIAALGGEGGGVLTDWIVAAATQLGFPVQSTSIPGVAQRTGATTYYIEIVPVARRELPARPVLALAPGIGDVDIVLASELMEAGRAIAGGFVTPDRTLMIASTARSYLVVEKMAMGDGRYDSARLIAAIESHARAHLLIDMEALAKESGAMINAVMLGTHRGLRSAADSGGGVRRRDPRRRQGRRRQPRRLSRRARGRAARERRRPGDRRRHARDSQPRPASPALEREIVASMPAPARDVILEGARRLAAYQDIGYARLYLDRLAAIRAADARCDAGGRLLRETARQLAVRMSYEDVIRVAQAKIDPARLARIAAEMGAKPGEPFTVTEFLKPGIEEMCSILPPELATRILALAERRGWIERAALGDGGQHRVGVGLSALLAAGQAARAGVRNPTAYQEEQRAIEAWLRPHRRGRATLGRSRARSRGMRAADQGLRRHLEARHRQLPPDRGADHPAAAGGRHPAAASRRRRRQRTRGRARRSRGRGAHALPRRVRAADQPAHRGRVTPWTLASRACNKTSHTTP